MLMQVLRSAVPEAALCADIAEAMEQSNIQLSDIAAWSPDEAADKLFLTPDEAVALLEACKRATGGVMHGDLCWVLCWRWLGCCCAITMTL